MDKQDMFEMFMNNINLMRTALDREEHPQTFHTEDSEEDRPTS
jgi:hypothetical protein